MTPEQQRIAIAEACGWKRCCCVTEHKDGCNGENPRGLYTVLPDYLNDLNETYKLEEHLIALNKWPEYCYELCEHTSGNYPAAVHAIASRRAKAFLKTLNLWKEISDDNH